MSLPVSVLDLVGMRPGETPGPAITRSADLARHAEQWGFRRFWLAEHHSIEGLACSATPVLIGHIAGATKTIRVGSGGVMLPNHAPLVVAEQFGTLEALYPGRIDLGLAALRAATSTRCAHFDAICGSRAIIFPNCWRSCGRISDRRRRGRL